MLVPAGHAALVGTVNSVVVAADPVEIVDFVVPVEIVVVVVPETAAVVVPGIVGAVVLGIADRLVADWRGMTMSIIWRRHPGWVCPMLC